MKKIILAILVFISQNCFAQNISEGAIINFKVPVKVQTGGIELLHKNSNDTVRVDYMENWVSSKISKIDSDYVILDPLYFKPSKVKKKKQVATVQSSEELRLNIVKKNLEIQKLKYELSAVQNQIATIADDPSALNTLQLEEVALALQIEGFKKELQSLEIQKKVTITNADKYNNKLFTIDRDDFDKYAIEKDGTEIFSIGLLTLPFKARPRTGDNSPRNSLEFDTEFNLNSTLNIYIFPMYSARLNLHVGAGIGSVGLNTNNSQIEAGRETDVATLTYFSGLMLAYHKVQVGIYFGVDHINNQSTLRWRHSGDVWYGFGIGYKIFDIPISGGKKNRG